MRVSYTSEGANEKEWEDREMNDREQQNQQVNEYCQKEILYSTCFFRIVCIHNV